MFQKNSFPSRLNPHPYNFLKVLYKKTILNAIISHIFFFDKTYLQQKRIPDFVKHQNSKETVTNSFYFL